MGGEASTELPCTRRPGREDDLGVTATAAAVSLRKELLKADTSDEVYTE